MTRLHTHSRGFTLLELMVTVSVAAILLAVGVPAFTDIIRNNRLTAAANDLLHSTHVARSEAVKRQVPVVVCATGDSSARPPSCNDGAFRDWIVFVDSNNNWAVDPAEMVLETHGAVHPSVTVRNDRNGILSYGASGFANPPMAAGKQPSTRIVICDRRGNQQIGNNSTARAIFIANTGRTRVTKESADVTQAIGIAGGCPQ